MNEELLTAINDIFDPWQPLLPGDPCYVDCRDVRGDADIIQSLGRSILLTNKNKCHLYAGHRGGGKSTELLRLKQHLEEHNCFVVYFAAEEADIDIMDTQYTDVLLSCVKQLMMAIPHANSQSILKWLKKRWLDIKDFLDTDVELENLKVEQQIPMIGKVTASLKFNSSQRAQIRQKIDPHVSSLRDALNEFIQDAKNNLPMNKTKLVMIVDNLDRIVPEQTITGKTNLDKIFIDRAEYLRSLDCSVVYTVPISLLHSSQITSINNVYDPSSTQILPMIKVRDRDGKINRAGLDKMRNIVAERVELCDPGLKIVPGLFANEEILDEICVRTGGYVRALMLVMQSLVIQIDDLPIMEADVNRCLSYLRNDQMIAVGEAWDILVRTAMKKSIENTSEYHRLLFNRSILHYVDLDTKNQLQPWYDINPLISGIVQFQDALHKVQKQG